MLEVGDKVRLVGDGFRHGTECDTIGAVAPCLMDESGGKSLYAQLKQNKYWVTDDPNSSWFDYWGVELVDDSTSITDTELSVGRFSIGDKAIVKPDVNPVWAKFGVGDVVKVNSDGTTLDVAFRGDAVREIFSSDYVCGQFNAEHLWKLV